LGSRYVEGKGYRLLVLTRKTGQSIVIGDGIEVTVLSVTGDKVRLGVEADRDVPIYRDEVHRRMAAESNGNGNGNGSAPSNESAPSNGSAPSAAKSRLSP
jgi:carbon storage regulator